MSTLHVLIGRSWPLVLVVIGAVAIGACRSEASRPGVVTPLPTVAGVEAQPLYAHARRLAEALTFVGSPLAEADLARLAALSDAPLNEVTASTIQQILDPYCLALVEISPEARVKSQRAGAAARLVEGGWNSFLIKVHNQAAITSPLRVASPNSEPLLHRSTGADRMRPENDISPGEVDDRFLELALYTNRPLAKELSGLQVEYALLQVYAATGTSPSTATRREARLSFDVGQGTQDLGFRGTLDVLFDVAPAVELTLEVLDHDGSPTMASFLITDDVERFDDSSSSARTDRPDPRYRTRLARARSFDEGAWDGSAIELDADDEPARLRGIYPLPSRRLAARDRYPDFFFQPQIYREDGETVQLPPGEYQVSFTRGPEYLPQRRRLSVAEGRQKLEASFQLERWIDMAALGWYSADHHIHAAGCSHYESPLEGVLPEHMWRQVKGEDLNLGSSLAWGPCWYYQKQFFTGDEHPLSTADNILRYDVEVSGFPSSHAGHLVLLQLEEDDYPGATTIEEWPSWTLPVLEWARGQGGVVGYAHSGLGLRPLEPTIELPNYEVPACSGIGANEYVVTVAHDAVDFYSAGNTPAPWELNMWYHALNNGFRTRISGETDFPCIFDERVGQARTYAKLDQELAFEPYIDALVAGRSYVSDGRAHIIDVRARDARSSGSAVELGVEGSELRLSVGTIVSIEAEVAAYLPESADRIGRAIASRPLTAGPFWHLERARVGDSRKVPVELVVNGQAVARQEVSADGEWHSVRFEHRVGRSSWVALRIYPAAHTNPVFVLVGDQPIRASRRSAEWALRTVDQCWDRKSPRIRPEELAAARAAYDQARQVYRRIREQASGP